MDEWNDVEVFEQHKLYPRANVIPYGNENAIEKNGETTAYEIVNTGGQIQSVSIMLRNYIEIFDRRWADLKRKIEEQNRKLYATKQKFYLINQSSDDDKLTVNPTVWGNIYRTSFFKENNIKFLHILFEDLVFSIYCLLKTKKEVIYLPDYPGYIYLIENKDSITHKVDMKTLDDFLTAMDLIYTLLNVNCSEDTKINLLNDMMNMVFFILSKLDKPLEGIKRLYDFENKLDFNLTPLSLPFNILNKMIMKGHFRFSLFLTKIMGLLYNNKKVRDFLFLKYKNIKKLDDLKYLNK